MRDLFFRFLLAVCLVNVLACATGAELNSNNQTVKGGFSAADDEVQFADLYNASSSVDILPVRGRLLEEELEDIGDLEVTPLSQISQDETKNVGIEIYLIVNGELVSVGNAITDDEGYFDTVVDISELTLKPGRYDFQIKYEHKFAGSGHVLLLDKTRTAPVVRSDVDLTYIHTDFHTTAAMFDLMSTSASSRVALPAMPIVYKALRGDDVTPLIFLSGSPKFFKRTIESKMVLDGIEQDGLVLKPFKDSVSKGLRGFSFGTIVPGLKEQVGYKLTALLKLRLQLPPSTPEILMGDDSEADVVAYNLYYRFLNKELTSDALRDVLKEIGVASAWITQVEKLAFLVEATSAAPPLAIYINKTAVTNTKFPVSKWAIPSITRYHQGAWPLVLDLQEEGLVGEDEVMAVRDALVKAGISEETLADEVAAADFLNPR